VLVGFVIFFFGSFAISVKVLNFQKRWLKNVVVNI
jgi:hypothetical protein